MRPLECPIPTIGRTMKLATRAATPFNATRTCNKLPPVYQ